MEKWKRRKHSGSLQATSIRQQAESEEEGQQRLALLETSSAGIILQPFFFFLDSPQAERKVFNWSTQQDERQSVAILTFLQLSFHRNFCKKKS